MIYAAVCCTARDEAPILREWMAFHRAVGFEKIILIDNGSTDATAEIVASFRDRASVDLIDRPDRSSQIALYDGVLARYAGAVEWIAFIDADEFLYPVDGTDIRHTIASFGEVGAIAVHWHVYGSNGHLAHPDGLTIDSFTRRAPDDFVYNRHVKSIVNLKHAHRARTSHLFEVEGGIVDDAGQELPMIPPYGLFMDKLPTYARLRINHYHVRSKSYYWSKATRGYFGIDDGKLDTEEKIRAMFEAHDRNEVEDPSAQRFKPLMRFYLQDGTG
ncbi:glycosyltransferase [Methylobacterium terricola]|uniref:Glycosyltransferase n=1 Tax=Methylobacterium terricola TaxID=2583531 RepID=A0A5C4L7F1_9HYPH|nr:glycosyltransferase family 2 protein [Methylobacterium terricola]TNC07867.1 glycosyltransferase [Methylobacterium terricola]